MMRRLIMLCAILLLAACGGGGGGGGNDGSADVSGGTPSSNPSVQANVVPITVDHGPASLNADSVSGISNVAYVSVTICAPGTQQCQTIDHVQVDTGSVGLRLLAGAVTPALAAALPHQLDASQRPTGECFHFFDGYVWGSIRSTDLTIGGESASGIPMQLVGDTGFAQAPDGCVSSGSFDESTVETLGANGILGIGPQTTDCGAACSTGQTGSAGYPYYACPATGCVQIAQGENASAPNQQLINPVSAFPIDNNGTVIAFPAVPDAGQDTLTGTLTFGIGTQGNNMLGAAQIFQITQESGLFTTIYNGATLPYSYIDSGTNLMVFDDRSIAECPDSAYSGFYCPANTVTLSAVNEGENLVSGAVLFKVGNAEDMDSSQAVLPTLAVAASDLSTGNAVSSSFVWGLPFFYGRTVYTAIQGAATPVGNGPYFAY